MEILLIVILVILSAAVFILMKQQARSTSSADTQSMMMMQQHIESLRSDMRTSLQGITDQVGNQLASVTQQIQAQTSTVGNRLDSAARVIGDVQRNLGELNRATQEMKELGQSMSKLEELLSAPKLRGGLGEFLLEDLLKQVLPADHFSMQYRFRNGHIVDAIIRTSDRMVPVDSKFPLENFRKILSRAKRFRKKEFSESIYRQMSRNISMPLRQSIFFPTKERIRSL